LQPEHAGFARAAVVKLAFTCIADLRCELAEGPVYDEQANRLWFCDILGRTIHAIDLGSGERASFAFETEVGSLGLAASGRLVVALRDAVILFDPTTRARVDLCRIEADRPETRLNDGRVGPDGAFWVGSMDNRRDKRPIGALYRVDRSGSVERKVEGVTISNGLAWTADGEVMLAGRDDGPHPLCRTGRRRRATGWGKLRCRWLLLERRRHRGVPEPLRSRRHTRGLL
jgi:sugar lactone lactonase YvrE